MIRYFFRFLEILCIFALLKPQKISFMKKLYLLLNFVLAFTIMAKAETSLFIDYLSDDDAEIALNVIGRIEIKDEVFRLISVEGTELSACNLYEVKKISFIKNSAATSIVDNNSNSIVIFPNPAQDVLFINGLESNDKVRLFDLQGKLILTSNQYWDSLFRIPIWRLQSVIHKVTARVLPVSDHGFSGTPVIFHETPNLSPQFIPLLFLRPYNRTMIHQI